LVKGLALRHHESSVLLTQRHIVVQYLDGPYKSNFKIENSIELV